VNGDLRLCQILTHYFSFSRSCERKPGSYRTISLSLALALFSSLSLAFSPSMHPILLATRGIKFVAPWRGDLLCRRQVCDERFGLCISAVSFVTGVCRCAPLCVFSRSCVCVHARTRGCMSAARLSGCFSRPRIALMHAHRSRDEREEQLLLFRWRCSLVSPLLSLSLRYTYNV